MCGESCMHGVERGKIWRLYQKITYRYQVQKRMVIGIIRIVLSGIILCSEIIRCQIKKQACAAVIAVKAADDLVKKAFHHQFFDHDPCPDAQAAAPGIPSLILRQFASGK